MPTTLYRYFDDKNQLLYVGITGDNTKRQSQHRRNAFWFGKIASATFEHFESRQDALAAEAAAIESELPKHNLMGRPSGSITHSPITHMIALLGKPDGGHGADHETFSSLFRTGLGIFDGKVPGDAKSVLSHCMIFAYGPWKNLSNCELCNAAFKSDWFWHEAEIIKLSQNEMMIAQLERIK